jgi:glycosyltransferase involved in cell wall biosynthesis
MKIINIPIEPLEERYSGQWNTWFIQGFAKSNICFETIYGDTCINEIKHGSFLDVIETNLYKTSQLGKILTYISTMKPDDSVVLFFHDLWFPGLINIAYMRDGLGLKNLKICGCLHAGSYDEYDFLSKTMGQWTEDFENSMLNIVDKIFVATQFHKDLLYHQRNVSANKIMVTGFPIYDDFRDQDNLPPCRENIIVFPHRLDDEKLPVLFDEFAEDPKMKRFKWLKTKEVCKTKNEYYELLSKSKFAISFARQETWGIAMQEAIICGCIPIVPNRLSYPEMYDQDFIYDELDEAKRIIAQFEINPPAFNLQQTRNRILKNGARAIPRMIEQMKKL